MIEYVIMIAIRRGQGSPFGKKARSVGLKKGLPPFRFVPPDG
jgi:hypothetical protein